MDLKFNISYIELLQFLKQLSPQKWADLKKEVDSSIHLEESDNNKKFKDFLLEGPTMSDEQYEQFVEDRKAFSSWRVE